MLPASGARRKFSTSFYARDTSKIAGVPPRQTGYCVPQLAPPGAAHCNYSRHTGGGNEPYAVAVRSTSLRKKIRIFLTAVCPSGTKFGRRGDGVCRGVAA